MDITIKDWVAIFGAFTGTVSLALTLWKSYKNRENLSFSKEPICYLYKEDYKNTMEERVPEMFPPHVGFVVDIVIDNPVDSSVTITDIKAYSECNLTFSHIQSKPSLSQVFDKELYSIDIPDSIKTPLTIPAHSSVACSIHFISYDTSDIDKIKKLKIEFLTHKKQIIKPIKEVIKAYNMAW